ncbi:MAG: hydrolase [Clostridiaceae bacterium]|nr:hydrolase [Clostridiaceae bacterium]
MAPISSKARKYIPEITSPLRRDIIEMPRVIAACSGIRIFGKRIKSIIYTTDAAQAINHNADALIAVYPFTPHPAITSAIIGISPVPVFAGVGGGTTGGKRCAQIAMFAEAQGAIGLVVNSPTTLETIRDIRAVVDTPIVCTIVSEYMDIDLRVEAGVQIFNVSGAERTVDIVKSIRKRYPTIPIIATGGSTDETILRTIEAGANAITYTPPTSAQLFKIKMDKYRKMAQDEYKNSHQLS